MTFRSFEPYDRSNVNSFTLTGTELIKMAFDVLQIGVDGEEVQAEDYARALTYVNLVLRFLQAEGLHISSWFTGFLFTEANVDEYILEDVKATNQYYSTTLSAASTSPTTSITVADSTNMTVGDQIGIFKDDNNIFWSTISSITPTVAPAATVVIDDNTDGDVASGNDVVTYTSAIQPISRILKLSRRENLTNDVPLTMLSREEYESLPNKSDTGTPSQGYYWRAFNKGKLYLWNVPADSSYMIRFWYETRIDDIKDPENMLDLDRTYLPVIVWSLAEMMATPFGSSDAVYSRVKMKSDELLAQALSYDDEIESFSVDISGGR